MVNGTLPCIIVTNLPYAVEDPNVTLYAPNGTAVGTVGVDSGSQSASFSHVNLNRNGTWLIKTGLGTTRTQFDVSLWFGSEAIPVSDSLVHIAVDSTHFQSNYIAHYATQHGTGCCPKDFTFDVNRAS